MLNYKKMPLIARLHKCPIGLQGVAENFSAANQCLGEAR
jgi:hypothetical protein